MTQKMNFLMHNIEYEFHMCCDYADSQLLFHVGVCNNKHWVATLIKFQIPGLAIKNVEI